MLDFILKVIGREYRAFRFKPRYMEISLGATSNPLESQYQIAHSAMHMLPYRELSTRKGTIRIPICEDADKVIDKLNLFNPLESPYQMVHSAMHMQTLPSVLDDIVAPMYDPDGIDIANGICMFARQMRISPIDQMIMYANNQPKKEKKLGVPTEKACLTDVTFDSVFADELHKLNTTEEEEDNKDV